MAATITLKRKCFDHILAIGDELVKGSAAGPRSQAYYDSLGKELGNASTEDIIKSNKGVIVGSDPGTRTLGGSTSYSKTAPKMNTEQVAKTSFNNGAKSTGAIQGLKNTWGRAGTMGKAGMIGAGVVGTGLALKGAASLFGGSKKD